MAIMVEKISAVTFRVSNMKASVQFYRDVLGMEVLYGRERAAFLSREGCKLAETRRGVQLSALQERHWLDFESQGQIRIAVLQHFLTLFFAHS
jgi:catechol 2,3-dioxygenase-like lactoylglutathione lyase family enzyme